MEATLEATVEHCYHFDEIFVGQEKDVVTKLRDDFVAKAESYFGAKGKIAEDGRYKVEHRECAFFNLDQEITVSQFGSVVDYVPLSVPTIRVYLDYMNGIGHTSGRHLLMLSELAEMSYIKKWLRFDAVYTVLNLTAEHEKRTLASLVFQEDYSDKFAPREYDHWEVDRRFLFDMLHYFYEKLPSQFERGKPSVVDEKRDILSQESLGSSPNTINDIRRRNLLVDHVLAGEKLNEEALPELYLPFEKARLRLLRWMPDISPTFLDRTIFRHTDGDRSVSLVELTQIVSYIQEQRERFEQWPTIEDCAQGLEISVSSARRYIPVTEVKTVVRGRNHTACYRVDPEVYAAFIRGERSIDDIRRLKQAERCNARNYEKKVERTWEELCQRRLQQCGLSLDTKTIDDFTIELEAALAQQYIHDGNDHAFELLALLYAPKISTEKRNAESGFTPGDKLHFARIGLFFALRKKVNGAYTLATRNIILKEMVAAIKTLRSDEQRMVDSRAKRLDAPVYADGSRMTLHEKLAAKD